MEWDNLKQMLKIIDHAYINRLCIHPTTHLPTKVADIVKNKGVCICDASRPHCPCPESIDECRERGWCKCRLFCSHQKAHDYLLKHGYIGIDGMLIKPGDIAQPDYD